MKILFVTPYVPSPVRVRPYHFVRCLAQEGHTVDVLSHVSTEREWEDLHTLSEHERVSASGIRLPSWRPWLNCSLALLKGESLWAAHGRSPRFSEAIRQNLYEGDYDVLHVEHIRSLFISPLLSQLRSESPRPKMIFDAVDCISALLSQYAERPGSLLRRAIYRREAVKMRRTEPACAMLFDRVIVTSETERQALAALMGDTGDCLEVVPNGVDLDYFRPSDTTPQEDTILFSGRMSFYNNAEAARYFATDIFPLIKAQRPKTRLILAGADPPSYLLNLDRRPDIEVTGYVEDLRPYLRRASVIACPILTAVGVQNKVLEAMAMGKPVVGTPLVSRALSAQQGKEIVIAEPEKGAFAKAVLSLLAEPESCRKLGLSARAYVERVHHWANSAKRLTEIYQAGSAEV
ncbi:MAG: glycosyltransferase [Armatimonadetes bacterium]|nr:glycosyltransferase [Armatimonadota bacterium]NIM23149.1 glycosyltransferase [Armatimonadota bacterium]NIM67017.1 glycosyltransferase [Armatimonadota bacterium]NIM75551.1 glycosyltransferase [Armatimonadota bacterium]NIN05206.1 glycosyltransferase [Armatimonadota bacterium]